MTAALATARPDVVPAPGALPAVGDPRCQMQWAVLPTLTWDRCDRPVTVDAVIVCGACGDYARSWCGPCSVDAVAAPPSRMLCARCDARGAVVVAVHPR